MISSWIFFAILTALSQAAMPMANEFFKVSSIQLLFWVRMVVVICLSPVLFLLPAPSDPIFYLCIVGTALCFGYFDVVYIGQAANTGAGSVTRAEGLVVGATFILWTALSPQLLQGYINEPLRSAGILAALAGGIFFALRMRKCEISRATLKNMAPAILVGALGVIFGKTAMLHSDFHSGVWYYSFLQSVFVFVLYLMVLNVKPLLKRFPAFLTINQSALLDRKVLIAGGLTALAWLVHTPSKYYAITQVENPAYVTLIGLTAPFWVLLAYRAFGRREKADLIAGFGVVFCAALLVVFTAL